MAEIEEAVYTRLTTYAPLAALIGLRAYPLLVPQDVALPAIAYQKISSTKTHNHNGSSQLARSVFQFTISADDYAAARAVAAALRTCWWGWRDTAAAVRIDGALVDAEQDDWAENHGAPVVRVDVAIWHAET